MFFFEDMSMRADGVGINIVGMSIENKEVIISLHSRRMDIFKFVLFTQGEK